MGQQFNITTEIPNGRPNVVVLHVGGWLDSYSEGKLVEAVQNAIAAGAQYALIDLADVSTITSAGIRAIQKSFGLLTPKGGSVGSRLKLCSASPTVYQVLSVTGMLLSVPMFESADIAIDSFGK